MAYRATTHQLFFLLLLLLAECIFLDAIQSNFSAGRCMQKEREALLKFKESLINPSGWLTSWAGKDCCNWMGVGCSNQTGNVVKLDLRSPDFYCDMVNVSDATSYNRTCLGGILNPSLLNLAYLNYLDLSQHNFQGMAIPDFLGSLKNLTYLDLSSAYFSGMVPPNLGNLSNLIHLDLTTFTYPTYLWVSDINWVSGLPSLQYLGLGGVNLSKASTNWLQAVNMLPSLLELHLSSTELQSFSQSLPIVNFTSLMVLDLSDNNFSTPIPQWVFNISTLVNLQLLNCQLTGHIPEISWGSLCNLHTLDLSFNILGGQIKEFIDALIKCNNNSLETLDLSSNNLIGDLHDSLGFLSNLEYLLLSQNSFSGPLPRSIGNFSQLVMLDLSFNNMNGTIPETIGQLTGLYELNLYGNSWKGIMTEIHLKNLTYLLQFDISSSSGSLIFNVRPDWTPPFNLISLAINNCQIGPAFPSWLKTQNQIYSIILSNAAISDIIPDWLWTFSSNICELDLSDNQLRGRLPNSIRLGFCPGLASIHLGSNFLEGLVPLWSNVTDLSLKHNLLSGRIPSNVGQVMSRLTNLDLSNNSLNGSIPPSINRMGNLLFLDLSSNHLSGNIPSNWQALQKLMIIDLSKNNLSGGIPSSICTLPLLFWLKLSYNNLSGELSSNLKNCTRLTLLDLGYNRFNGTISAWIIVLRANLLPLSMIVLRANMLTGNIPEQLCLFIDLHILDLAQNNLSGSIPKCLGNMPSWKTLATLDKIPPSVSQFSFSQHLELLVKGRIYEFTSTIPLLHILDLSDNVLSGEIPEEITNVSGLGTLNLSWNQFTGKIPESIGNLRWLETLDLSCNQLVGHIPLSMPSMTSLNHLNLSHNNLSGQIPYAGQLQTLNDPSIYEGNPALCGPPLPRNCFTANGGGTIDRGDKVEDGHDTLWFYVSMGLGFIIGFWAVCGTLVINKPWRHAYFKFIDEIKDKLCLVVSLNVAHLQRKLERSS